MSAARAEPTVLIVGGGPVGLSVAALLLTGACAGRIRVRVLESRPLTRWDGQRMGLRVYALSRASQELFERLGIWPAVVGLRACPYRRMRVWEGGGPDGPGSLDFDSADIGEPDLGHVVEDGLLRTLLSDLVASSPCADVDDGAELESVAVSRSGVDARLRDGRGVSGALLVGADGTESAVRSLMGMRAVSRAYAQSAIVAHVASELPHRQTAWQRFLPGGPLAFLPLADGRSSVVWSLPAQRAEILLRVSERSLLDALQQASGGVLGKLGPVSQRGSFPLQALHVLRYCGSRVALVGDAAHTVHPLAGQGMNLGLLDAVSLAAAIERAVLRGEDPGDLRVLRGYERQRKGDNLGMLLAFDALHRVFRLPAWAAPARAACLGAVNASGGAKRALMHKALRLGAKTGCRWPRTPQQT